MRASQCVFFIIILLFCSSVSADQPSVDISKADHIEGVYIPNNLEESWAELEKNLAVKDRQRLKEISEADMVKFHLSYGMDIRNSWGLWRGSRLAKYFNNLGIHHPDDMSSIILDTFWCHINNKPIRLEERIAYYKEFWLVHSDPSTDTFPESDIDQVGGQNYDTPEGNYLGYIHVYRGKESGKVWLYEYNKGWKIADDDFLNAYPHWKDNLTRHE